MPLGATIFRDKRKKKLIEIRLDDNKIFSDSYGRNMIFVYIRDCKHELYIKNNREYEIGDVITAVHAVYGAEYGAGHVFRGCGGWRCFYELG